MLKDNPKIIIPNFFTSLNILIGFTSVYFSFYGDFDKAAWVILLSVLMDKMDGTSARLFNASSEFGVEFDSFSDFFSFGIAPAMMFLFYYAKQAGEVPSYIFVACAVYILFFAIRLAKFNTIGKEDGEYFHGLTTTQSGAMLSAFYLLCKKYNLEIINDSNMISGMIIGHGILLVTNIKYPKFKKRKTFYMNVIQSIVLAFLVTMVLIRKMPEIIYITGIIYVVGGVFYTKMIEKKHYEKEETSPGN